MHARWYSKLNISDNTNTTIGNKVLKKIVMILWMRVKEFEVPDISSSDTLKNTKSHISREIAEGKKRKERRVVVGWRQ